MRRGYPCLTGFSLITPTIKPFHKYFVTLMEGCPPHTFTDGGSIIFCTLCGTQLRKITEDPNCDADSIDELLSTLEQELNVSLLEQDQCAPKEEEPCSEPELPQEPINSLHLTFSIMGHEVNNKIVYYFLRVMNDGVPVCACSIRFNHLKSFHDTFRVGLDECF